MYVSELRASVMFVVVLTVLTSCATSAFGAIFTDGFEAPVINSFWSTTNDVSITSEVSHTGSCSLALRNEGGVSKQASVFKHYLDDLHKGLVSVWFYDDMSFSSADTALMLLDNSLSPGVTGWQWRLIPIGESYYAYDGLGYTEGPTRTVGWHCFSIDLSGAGALADVDGHTVVQISGDFGFSSAKVFNNASGITTYWDDFTVSTAGVAETPEPSSILALAALIFPFGAKLMRKRRY